MHHLAAARVFLFFGQWIAVVGPDTPGRGEVGPAPTVYLSNVAATLLYYLGLDPTEYNSQADRALPVVAPALFRR